MCLINREFSSLSLPHIPFSSPFPSSSFFSSSFLDSVGDQTQGLEPARQAPHHWAWPPTLWFWFFLLVEHGGGKPKPTEPAWAPPAACGSWLVGGWTKGRAPASLTVLSQFLREKESVSVVKPAAGRATQPTAFFQELSRVVKLYSQALKFFCLLALASSWWVFLIWLVCGTQFLLEKQGGRNKTIFKVVCQVNLCVNNVLEFSSWKIL